KETNERKTSTLFMPNASIAQDNIVIPDKSPAFVVQYAKGKQKNELTIKNVIENQRITIFNEDDNEAYFYGKVIAPNKEGTTFIYGKGIWQKEGISETETVSTTALTEKSTAVTLTPTTTVIMGENSKATGNSAIAMGENNVAKGDAAISIGAFNTANQAGAIAMGFNAFAGGDYAISLGQNNKAMGNSAFATGYKTQATGDYAASFGKNTLAKGDASLAIGAFNEANGNYATTMGEGNIANGNFSMAMGNKNNAEEPYSITVGKENKAKANAAIAIGNGTITTAFQEIAMGSYNTFTPQANATTWQANDRLFVIGNGTSETTRADAFIVLKNGNATFTHNLTVNGTLSHLSDIRFKKNVVALEMQGISHLQKVSQLKGYTYHWKADEFPDKYFAPQTQIGMMAQEVEVVYPEVVTINEMGEKGIDYAKLTPILLEAIKELAKENQELTKRVEQLEQKNNSK
ncbi:MAG: tail fiber domain-containing protein, partial [Bacteroidia bacterium]